MTEVGEWVTKVEPCEEGSYLTMEAITMRFDKDSYISDELMVTRYADDGTLIIAVANDRHNQSSITLNPELTAQLARFIQTGDI